MTTKTAFIAGLAGCLGLIAIGCYGATRSHARRRPLRDVEGRAPANWWRAKPPGDQRACYATKTAALTTFLDVNRDVSQNYGGVDYRVSPSEFDAINHKYDLRGKSAARTIAEDVWAAMPEHKPYCLDRIDLDALNDTSPAREGMAFRLPDHAYESAMVDEEARHYARVDIDTDERVPF